MKGTPLQGKNFCKRFADKMVVQLPRSRKHKLEKSHGDPNTKPHRHINPTIKLMKEVQSAGAEKQLWHLRVATAMMNVADGGSSSLNVGSFAHQALKKGFRIGEKYYVGETLAPYNKDLDPHIVSKSNGDIEILDPCAPTQVCHVQAGNGELLPPKVFTHIFKIIVQYADKMMDH